MSGRSCGVGVPRRIFCDVAVAWLVLRGIFWGVAVTWEFRQSVDGKCASLCGHGKQLSRRRGWSLTLLRFPTDLFFFCTGLGAKSRKSPLAHSIDDDTCCVQVRKTLRRFD